MTFLQSSGTSPNFHGFSKSMESGLAMMSAGFLNTLMWVFSGHIDLQGSSYYNNSQIM